MVAVKICGLTSDESVKVAVDAGADYIGFVFFEQSPRNISVEQAATLAAIIPDSVKKIAVLVNPDDELLTQVVKHLNPDYIQLHGDESAQRVLAIKQKFNVKIIKAFSIFNLEDIDKSNAYLGAVEMLLFDAKAPEMSELPGGNGLSFDWNMLAGKSFELPWILSGGLNIENIKTAAITTVAQIVDVSSGVEREKGVKDNRKIKEFIKLAKQI